MSDAMLGRVLGRVRLHRVLGEGAAGIVYLGRHQTLDKEVAVKVLKGAQVSADPRYRERFRREARIAADINHPSIVRVIDYGEEGETFYLVMDYIDGYSLGTFLRRRGGPLDEPTVLKILVSVATALNVAHKAGIVHRDLKPDNLLLARKGSLHLADLGLAKQGTRTDLTQERTAVGSPAYMAPESVTPGLEIDHRADLYALGVIGYQAMFGQLPYRGDLQQTIQGHRDGMADWALPNHCSKRTLGVIRRLMAPNREDRYQSAAELLTEIRPHFSAVIKREKRARASSSSSSGEGSGSSTLTSDFGSVVRFMEDRLGSHTSTHQGGQVTHTTSRERLLVWLLLLTVVGLAVGGWVISREQAPPPEPVIDTATP